MGCFLSKNKPNPSTKFHHVSSRSNRTPPPVVVDVETVKEVLSETPNFKKVEDDSIKISSRHNSNKFQQKDHIFEHPNVDNDIDVFCRKMIERSPAKSRNKYSGELQPVRKSPVRGKDQSPGRVESDSDRNGRGSGFGSAGRQRPGSGNVSAARSRSPAKRTVAGGGGGGSGGRNEIGRSLSGRRTGKSPGRVGSDLHERVRKPEMRSDRVREESNRFMAGSNNDESLENPLVSLECFIFL